MASPPDIEQRTMDYAVRAIALFKHLKSQKDESCAIIGRQYVRAATSVGANLVEARGGESRADFIHKCAIAQKESREAMYWLRLMERATLVNSSRLAPLVRETDEILAIVTTIIRNAKANSQGRKP